MRLFAVIALLGSLAALAALAATADVASVLELEATPTPTPTPTPAPASDSGAGGPPAWLLVASGAMMLAIVAALAVTLVVVRVRTRRRRQLVRYELVPFRGDHAGPEHVRRLLESWHQQLLPSWRRRLQGQRWLALEVLVEPDRQGRLTSRLQVAMPLELRPAVEGALRACYPNIRLRARDEPPPDVREIVRLKKRRGFIEALHAPDDDDPVVIDAVLAQMVEARQPCVFQLTLTPAPAAFDSHARSRFKRRERSATRARSWNRSEPGMSSQLLTHELEAGLQVQHRPLFFTELRVGAQSEAAARAVAGAVRGGSGSENRLVARQLYWGRRRRLYHDRIRRAFNNPLPGWRRAVYSSSELTGVWRLPSPALRGVPLTRSPLPRMQAPPEVSRRPTHALLHDDDGPVGVLAGDKSDGLGLIGGQKTGKTSVLCRSVQVDAADPDCALLVLMPKPGDALKALSTVPEWRTVHYLDFESPEFGINPLLADGDPAMVADKVVEAFRDVNAEGDIKGSSDRFLRQAAQASIGASRAGAIEGPPTLWHMYRILLPSEEDFRRHVVEAIFADPRFTDTATYFGRDLPNDLRDATVNTASKLDAPRNKILRLMVESLDKVLRHPRQLDLDQVVANREVLVVDGKMGTFGADNCRVMMQFILNMLYGTLQRRQQLPDNERIRIAVKVDEAHLVINDSFADALATLRSAGLEMVAAWQYGEQIQDPKIRAGMMSLLRQRCMFSMGEPNDARGMAEIAMTLYADMIRDEPESRARVGVTPDIIYNLPNHHALCSWIADGARQPAFLAQTIPMATDEHAVAHHLDAQRERGCFVPDRLPDPLPDAMSVVASAADQIATPLRPIEVGGSNGAAPPPSTDDDTTTLEDEPNRIEGAPDSYTELDLDSMRGLTWDDLPPQPETHEPTRRELEILAALARYGALFTTQVRRRWWPRSSLRACQQGLARLRRAGLVRRGRFTSGDGGAQQAFYVLTRAGHELAQNSSGPRGPYVDPDESWREPPVDDIRFLIRSLHLNGWVLALEALAGRSMDAWRAGREARILPPRRRVRGEWKDLGPGDANVGGRVVRGLPDRRFEPVSPAARVELNLRVPDGPMRLELLIELERGRGSDSRDRKLRRYDAMLTAWARMLDRYEAPGTPPLVVFVAEDEPSALEIVRQADDALTGALAKAGEPEDGWPYPGRRSVFVACERDAHLGSLAAYALPEHPPELRVRLGGEAATACKPRRVNLVEPRLFRSE